MIISISINIIVIVNVIVVIVIVVNIIADVKIITVIKTNCNCDSAARNRPRQGQSVLISSHLISTVRSGSTNRQRCLDSNWADLGRQCVHRQVLQLPANPPGNRQHAAIEIGAAYSRWVENAPSQIEDGLVHSSENVRPKPELFVPAECQCEVETGCEDVEKLPTEAFNNRERRVKDKERVLWSRLETRDTRHETRDTRPETNVKT